MESKIDKSNKQLLRADAGMLPHYFKNIGIGIIAFSILLAIIFKTIGIDYLPILYAKTIVLDLLILGLLLSAWAVDKVEDELIVLVRLKSMEWAFHWVVLYVIVMPLVDLLFGDPISELKAHPLVLSMLIAYHVFYFFQKRNL